MTLIKKTTPTKKKNIRTIRAVSRTPQRRKTPLIRGGGGSKKKIIHGGADQYGRDEPAQKMGDQVWGMVQPLIQGQVTPDVLNKTKDFLYRGSWDYVTDQIRPQMGNAVSQVLGHIPLIGQSLANISNMF